MFPTCACRTSRRRCSWRSPSSSSPCPISSRRSRRSLTGAPSPTTRRPSKRLLRARLAAGGASTTAKADADAVADRSWNAIYSVLDGKQQVPGPEQAPAARLFSQLFPGGRGWLNEKHEVQWAQADARLRLLAADRAATTALLGKPLYDFVESAHADHGAALGIGPLGAGGHDRPAHPRGDRRFARRDPRLRARGREPGFFAAAAAAAVTAQLAPLLALRARAWPRSPASDPGGRRARPAGDLRATLGAATSGTSMVVHPRADAALAAAGRGPVARPECRKTASAWVPSAARVTVTVELASSARAPGWFPAKIMPHAFATAVSLSPFPGNEVSPRRREPRRPAAHRPTQPPPPGRRGPPRGGRSAPRSGRPASSARSSRGSSPRSNSRRAAARCRSDRPAMSPFGTGTAGSSSSPATWRWRRWPAANRRGRRPRSRLRHPAPRRRPPQRHLRPRRPRHRRQARRRRSRRRRRPPARRRRDRLVEVRVAGARADRNEHQREQRHPRAHEARLAERGPRRKRSGAQRSAGATDRLFRDADDLRGREARAAADVEVVGVGVEIVDVSERRASPRRVPVRSEVASAASSQ